MPGLYGQTTTPELQMYGSAPVQKPLSETNQATAAQLNLPGYGDGAGSQQEAQSDWANFEDIFNKNQGYAKSALENAKNTVALKGVDTSGAQKVEVGGMRAKAQPTPQAPAPQAPAGTANPMAPAPLQSQSLTGIQSKSDVLSGYGDQPQAFGGAGGTTTLKLPTNQGDRGSRLTEQPVYSQSADTAAGGRSSGRQMPSAPAPVYDAGTTDSDGDGVMDNPFAGSQGGYDTGAPATPPPAQNPAEALGLLPPAAPAPTAEQQTAQGEGSKAGKGAHVNPVSSALDRTPLKPTEEEYAKDDELTQKNQLLAGWGDDNGLDILQQVYGPEASQWDADIMATGGGRTAQAELSKKYGQEQKDFRAGVEGRIADQKARNAQTRGQLGGILGGFGEQGAQVGGPGAGDGGQGKSEFEQYEDYGKGASDAVLSGQGEGTDHDELNKLLFGEDKSIFGDHENPWSNMHSIGMTLNPADWATIAIGEAGTDVPVTTEMFSKNFDMSGGEIQKTWPQGRFLMAFNILVNDVSPVAKHAFINFLKANPAVMKEYLSYQNPGYMARNMRMWMKSWQDAHPDQADVLGADPYNRNQQANLDPNNPDVRH